MRECNQCGKCCQHYARVGGLGSVSDEDLLRWRRRPDILAHVGPLGDLWISPDTGEEMDHCPWLAPLPDQRGYTCQIYPQRPDVCRDYPLNVQQMIKDDCEMLEETDLPTPAYGLLYYAIVRGTDLMWFGAADAPEEAMLGMISDVFFERAEYWGHGHRNILADVDSRLGRIADYRVVRCEITDEQYDRMTNGPEITYNDVLPFLREISDAEEDQ